MQNLKDKTNRVYICGEIVGEPTLSHEEYDEKFYKMTVKIQRLSGQADNIPVTISERLMPAGMLRGGGKYLCLRSIPLLQQNHRREIKTFSHRICA